jgi:hypothetical protein
MKKIILALLGLGIIAAGIGLYLYNKPVESLEHKKAEVETDAATFISEYEADENAANTKYLGKIVSVSGKVSGVTNSEGIAKVVLDAGSPMSSVICDMDQPAADIHLQPGDEARIKGICSGYLSDIVMVQAWVEKQ